jgi:hypothetical protein
MASVRPPLFAAAFAMTVSLAAPALAQQPPIDTPLATPQAQPAPNPGYMRNDERDMRNDQRGPRWRQDRGYRGGDGAEERSERWNRRSSRDRDDDRGDRRGYGRAPMGEREAMMPNGARMVGSCGQPGRFGEAMIQRLERTTRPTPEQRAAFDALKEAATKAAGIVQAACPAERALTPTGRLAAAERRLSAMLEAVRTVRPAMEAFYGSLSDEQKARVFMSQPRMGQMGARDGADRGDARDEQRGWGRQRDGWRRDGERSRGPDRFGRDDQQRGGRTTDEHNDD